MDKLKHGEKERSAEQGVKQTTHWTLPKLPIIDWCQVRSLFFTLTALILLLAIGAWVGMKLEGGSGVDIHINNGEEKINDLAQEEKKVGFEVGVCRWSEMDGCSFNAVPHSEDK